MELNIKKQYHRTFETLTHLSVPIHRYHLASADYAYGARLGRVKVAKKLAGRSFANKGREDYPESKFLSIGDVHCLNHEEVEQFVAHLQSWLDTGSLKLGE